MRRQLLSSAHLDATDDDRKGLWTFYAGRRGGPVWVDELGWGPAALAVIDEMRRADDWGLDASAFEIPELVHELDGPPTLDEKSRAAGELALSLAVLKYARHARGGRIETPDKQLSSYLDRKPQVRRPWRVMTEIADAVAPDAYLRGLNPQHPQFEALRQRYLAMRNGTGTHVEVPERGQKLAPGTTHPDVALVRERLGVAPGDGDPDLYDPALVEAVKKYQRRKDLSDTGVIDRRTRRALNATVNVSEKALLANMEQWRWMPENLGEAYVWVNIPEFMMRVVKDGNVVHEERVVDRPRLDADADLLRRHADDLRPPALVRAREHQDEGGAAEHGGRRPLLPQHGLQGAAQRPRDQSAQRQMVQDRHPLLRHLSAAGARQCAGDLEVHLPQQARRLHARHAQQGPVQLDASARSATAACASGTPNGSPRCCSRSTRAGTRRRSTS